MSINYQFKLSQTSKMPCASFPLPAKACKTGAKLAKIRGSVCSGCYALKGFYNMPNVRASRDHNLATLPKSDDLISWALWTDKMIDTIRAQDSSGFFRWHDSGDIQSLRHLEALCYIAYRMPEIQFWLPTKEKGCVGRYLKAATFPNNLVVRVSSAMIDQAPSAKFKHTSTVHKDNAPIGFECQAYQHGGKCMRCRACWDSSIPNISYPKH